MRRILQIISRPPEPNLAHLLKTQQELPDHQVSQVNLSDPGLNYESLLDQIFEADSIQVF